MKLVTFLLPEGYVHGLDELVQRGLYQSRSAAIRLAVRDLLMKELWRMAEKSEETEAAHGRTARRRRPTRPRHRKVALKTAVK